jgi:hypothetical protein
MHPDLCKLGAWGQFYEREHVLLEWLLILVKFVNIGLVKTRANFLRLAKLPQKDAPIKIGH